MGCGRNAAFAGLGVLGDVIPDGNADPGSRAGRGAYSLSLRERAGVRGYRLIRRGSNPSPAPPARPLPQAEVKKRHTRLAIPDLRYASSGMTLDRSA
jgi:hypothetical protein